MGVETKDRLEDVFIEMGGKLSDLIGWKRVVGQVYVLLYITNRPLPLDDIAERINISKSTVWGAIKKLQNLCALHKAWVKDERKDCFTAEQDLAVIFRNGILPGLNSKILFAGSYLEQVEGMLAGFCQNGENAVPEEAAKLYDLINEFAKQKNKIELLLKQAPLLLGNTNKFGAEGKESY